jgi:plastocyanin
MRELIGRSTLGLSGLVLGIALSAWPFVASAQGVPQPQAMVELASTDINSWGFSAVVPIGGTISWTNMGGQAHTVTATDGSFDSGLVDPGGVASIQFDVPGKYAYLCTPHPWMKGFVIVTPDVAGGTASSMAMVEGNPSDINSWSFAASVSAGQTVVWTNTGEQAHTVTSTAGAFDTGMVTPGSSAPLVFDTPGLYPYVCTPHPWMKGAVVAN